jgi:sarcosine oxidase
MRRHYDVIVLGLGGIGSAAAYWLARRGLRVLGLEQFEFGHARGESHDHTRIIRLSYHAEEYVRLAKEAYQAWADVESDAKRQLVYVTGGLDLGPQDGAISLETYAGAMTSCGVDFEWLDAAQIRTRFPQFTIGPSVRGLFQAQGGFVAAERATAAHQQLARNLGAELLERAPVTAIRNDGGCAYVKSGDESYAAPHLVIAAGPWTNQALSYFDMRLPLEVTKEQPMYLRPPDLSAFEIGKFPVWIWMDDPSFYGFPVFGEPAVKIAQDAGGKPVDPDTRSFDADPDITQRVHEFVERVLPSARGPEHLVKTCLYTLPPDRDFIIDTLPEHPNVYLAVGAGHAFKFASVIGRIMSELVIDSRTPSDIGSFRVDREILTMDAPPKTYMV